MAQQPTAASALYPHLKSGTPEPVQRQHGHDNSIAQTMYPRPPTRPTNPHREALLRHLKEANANIEARQRERGR